MYATTSSGRPAGFIPSTLLGEARVHHEQAKGKKDHDEAIRKAKLAQGLADEAQKLQH